MVPHRDTLEPRRYCGLARVQATTPANHERALDALSHARTGKGGTNYRSTLREAERQLHAGEEALRKENERWWPFLSYRVPDSLFKESIRLSQKAASIATGQAETRHRALLSNIDALTDSLDCLKDLLSGELNRTDIKVLYRQTRLKLDLASQLAETDSDGAAIYVDSTRSSLGILSGRLLEQQAILEELLVHADRWALETVKRSAETGKHALVVDKSVHTIYVLKAGAVVDSYTCDLGYNAGYQKKMSGDGATPEGMYRVVEVKKNSKYYRALLLDYPNKYDKQRFEKNLRGGLIPAGSHIGGLIEIHGEGGRNEDWTEGCVAVSNEDMNALLKVAPVGTPVTIVRSWDGIQ